MSARRAARSDLSPTLACGYTLLELLIVITVIAITVAGIGLSSGMIGGDRRLQSAISDLRTEFELACELAELEGRPHGLRLGPRSARLEALDGEAFVPLSRRRPLPFPAGLSFKLEVLGEPVTIADEERIAPELLCLPEDERVPFKLRAELAGVQLDLTANPTSSRVEARP